MIIPYITFCGECREVLEFYRTVFNGTVRMLQTYGSYVPENVDAYINLPPTETFYSAFHGGLRINMRRRYYREPAVGIGQQAYCMSGLE